MILRNRARCSHCLQVVESKHRHDFRSCKCGGISVDGGKNYIKRSMKGSSEVVELSLTDFDLSTLAGRLYEHRIGDQNLSRTETTRIMTDYYEWFRLNIDTFEPEWLAGSNVDYLSELWDEWIGEK